MNETCVTELLDKISAKWPGGDVDAWRAALAPLDYHEARNTLNQLSTHQAPTAHDFLAVVPDPNRMPEADRLAGLEHLARIRERMGWRVTEQGAPK